MSRYHHRFVEGKTVNVEMCIRGKMLVNQSINRSVLNRHFELIEPAVFAVHVVVGTRRSTLLCLDSNYSKIAL